MSTKKLSNTPSVEENPLFHDTWKLLKNYRDAVWNLELAVRQIKNDADITGTHPENYAKCIEQSSKMLNSLHSAIETLRNKHKHGEQYYWILYYTYLSPQQLQNTDEIIENLTPHITNISKRTYYRKRPEAIQALSSILWVYPSNNCLEILDKLLPTETKNRHKIGTD